MGIVDDIRKGADEARRQMEREQQQAAEQARQAAKRAEDAKDLWVYLERYREAIGRKYGPQTIECAKPKLFRSEYKTVYRNAWLISTHYRGVDAAGEKVIYRLWLDAMTCEVWWQHYGRPARRVTLGEASPHLSAEENQILEQAEEDMPRNLGALAARNGIELLTPGD